MLSVAADNVKEGSFITNMAFRFCRKLLMKL